ncbi:putative NEK kinase [Blattamonas nauphoetae]|uniref:non-specific serine/threonine protein kinase n=1 Tax=Blattamonas nauphoetae TaxID=2049346 RepID=A0ABQ9Y2S7_9EUKA|nr:putative NEK kinase [Blattamonas nauphoetae]
MISEGAFGQVVKVVDERSGVPYAVKVLPMLKEGDKERVNREVEMLTRFAHRRIVGLHESIDMGGHQAIVMELGHRSLKDLILEYEERKELIPPPLTVMILVDICEGLLWMHTHSSGSTAHGDLKPENVLLRENNRAFLCDLGGSAPLDQQMTSTIGELGTFEYNSPERAMDSKGTPTPASDVWSLGVLAYRMVTGKGLFEGLHLLQLSVALHTFDESKVALSIDPCVREVLLKMLDPNVGRRATTTALFEGGLLEGMLGPETVLSKMKTIQVATGMNEIKQSLSDVNVKEKTMELLMEKEKLVQERDELERELRSVQQSLERTRERNLVSEKEEEDEQRRHLLARQTSSITMDPDTTILSNTQNMHDTQFNTGKKDEKQNDRSLLSLKKHTFNISVHGDEHKYKTTLFDPVSEGVVSLAITVLAIPEIKNSDDGLMVGLVDALSPELHYGYRKNHPYPSSIAFAPKYGKLHAVLPSTKQQDETIPISPWMNIGDRVVLEVDMDARPRTAVFIINGNVPLTFVSGLPPSIRFVYMTLVGLSVRFEGISRLKHATPLRRVIELKWNPEEVRDSADMFMNGMRSSVLTVQTQMPSLVFTDPSHFRVEDNIITSTGLVKRLKYRRLWPAYSSFFLAEPISEGIVAISFNYLIEPGDRGSHSISFGLIDGTAPIPEKKKRFGKVQNSMSLTQVSELHFWTLETRKRITVTPDIEVIHHLVVEINMDSTPRTAKFFINGVPAETVVVGLPESVHAGFSAKGEGPAVRIDRITHLNRGSAFTEQVKVVEWPTAETHQGTDSDDDCDEKKKPQLPMMKLPELLFTNKSHFLVRSNILTRTEKGTGDKEGTRSSTVLFAEPITKGVVSLRRKDLFNFGLLDSSLAVPSHGQDSVGLSSGGKLHVFSQIQLADSCCSSLSMNDRVVMEVNMDSTPRTVQFFVNGKCTDSYVSGIPESVRIGVCRSSFRFSVVQFSADVIGTSLQITSIVHSTQATPLSNKMLEIKWTDSKQSLEERKEKCSKPIRREAEGSMPALLMRNPEHFKIDGNVITRTAFDSAGLTSPFSTVVFAEIVDKAIMSVTVTIPLYHLSLSLSESPRSVEW